MPPSTNNPVKQPNPPGIIHFPPISLHHGGFMAEPDIVRRKRFGSMAGITKNRNR
jgi:hypothetical protein